MTPAELKALGETWGEQGGLLSVAELDVLMRAVESSDAKTFFEVGHYYGLSTCALVHALKRRGTPWNLTTLDAHVPDAWVGRPASIGAFEKNRANYFDDDRLTVIYELSQIVGDVPAEFVFYDGDHGEEQLRFTRALIASAVPRTFLFDDRDFTFPRQCCEELRAAGWTDKSPELSRLPGDKTNASTMTIAWFERSA